MTDKDFWLLIRRALLLIISAIEKKYLNNKGTLIETTETDSVSFWIE